MRNTSTNLESDLQSTGVRDWNVIKHFRKPPITFDNFPRASKFFEHFLTLPKISENFRKFSKNALRSF